MHYISTRGHTDNKNFTDVLLAGLAPDGGLFVPSQWPAYDANFFEGLKSKNYADIAKALLAPYIGDTIETNALNSIIDETYSLNVFSHQAVAPLVQIDTNLWIMELFHGPTLSFKDYALQLVGRLFDHVLQQRGERITIVGATSGDTGSAAIESCKSCSNIDIFILHPHGRTSDIQRKQMTTVNAPNVHNIALEGSFDDCQDFVKALFADTHARNTLNLSAVNSINWARIMTQTVYYISSALALGAPQKDIAFSVPTGNFGNVFAGWIAKQTGVSINQLIIGSNKNDILTRFFETGIMKQETVTPTISPSMDIQISSNFERYLYHLLGYNHNALARRMAHFKTDLMFDVSEQDHAKAKNEFHAYRCDDQLIYDTMRKVYKNTGYIIDPHTAVGVNAAYSDKETYSDNQPHTTVALACAHPAKFPDAVKAAIDVDTELPPHLEHLLTQEEHYTVMDKNYESVKRFIIDRSGLKAQ